MFQLFFSLSWTSVPVFSFDMVLFFLITNMFFLYLIDLWYVFPAQYGGAFYNEGGDLTFEGSATLTSCSAKALLTYNPDYDDEPYVVSGSDELSGEA